MQAHYKTGKSKHKGNIKDFDFVAFSKHVAAKRNWNDMTCQEVADLIGCSKATISKMERGLHMPSVPDFLFLCWFWDLNPLDYFIPDAENIPPKTITFVVEHSNNGQ